MCMLGIIPGFGVLGMSACVAGKAQSRIYGDRLGPVESGKRAQQSLKKRPTGVF